MNTGTHRPRRKEHATCGIRVGRTEIAMCVDCGVTMYVYMRIYLHQPYAQQGADARTPNVG